MKRIVMILISIFSLHVLAAEREVIIAVIDSGLDIYHPEIKSSLWVNADEIPGNNKDDDGNGYIDDLHGWDFIKNQPVSVDPNGHGTHIAGIIAGKGERPGFNRGLGFGTKIMALRYYSAQHSGEANIIASIKAFEYAIQNHAHIINYSGGGTKPDRREEAVIQRTFLQNILVVAAAGNFGTELKESGFYPASYPYENIVSVAAIDKMGKLIRPSNYGVEKVDLSAFGKEVLSILPNKRYGRMSGTSQATAYVSALAGSLMLKEPQLKNSPQELAHRLAFVGLKHPALKRKLATEAYLEPKRALNIKGPSVDAFGDSLTPRPVLDALLQPSADEIDALSKYLLQ